MLQAQQNIPQLSSIAVPTIVSAISSKPWYNTSVLHFNKLRQPVDTSTPTLSLMPVPSLLISNVLTPVSPIRQDFYTQHFGFFCRQELHLEKLSRMPLRFRLGSLKDCNYLEGK
ncbi:hypothetical protein [Paraflavitalea speifideaquila]|uniref:hypothetical protein n=1 Tax=Paraflavitalea speifideaquila TaxID=3076558 RepID=UPI0028E98259|nr:hypothetical protein [Paraflavitalea speifideiaquila]